LNIEKRIHAFIRLGEILRYKKDESSDKDFSDSINDKIVSLNNAVLKSHHYNNWFIEENVRFAIQSIAVTLTKENLIHWIKKYSFPVVVKPKKIAVIMAGNIPLVGFHDFLCVLISGNYFIGKLSSDDKFLLPAIAELLIAIEPGFANLIEFTESKLEKFDAVVATGSNNTSRYFEYYFGKYPHIIRKNRNAVAILDGSETREELSFLADDIFMYYGLGCRSVSKLYVPKDYNFSELLLVAEKYRLLSQHHKYFNNYEYNKAIFLINNITHMDSGFVICREDETIASPISVLNYEYYSDLKTLSEKLQNEKEKLQCIVGHPVESLQPIPFGQAQKPMLWNYADGIDTIEFLNGLK